ncbi:MAG: hypothetical protein HQM10_11165 [Candidatus Riflebacteria bacterium]|nr:hypothetical protein [Candidatus Riflebacteria bacterium]
MKKLPFVLLLIMLITELGISNHSADAWGPETHQKMTSDAFFIMPPAFRKFIFAAYKDQASKAYELLIESCNEPDRVLKDFRNHIFHIHGSDMGNGPIYVATLSSQIVDDIRSRKPINQIIQKLGWLAHYVEDLGQPLHTGIATWEGIEEKSFHSSFEKDIDKHVLSFGVNYDGASAVKRVSARLVYEALWGNQYYDLIQAAYTNGKGYEEVKKSVFNCYSRAVNNVVDIWYTIWIESGGKPDPKKDSKPKFFPPIIKMLRMDADDN